jgi:hypothetical protein
MRSFLRLSFLSLTVFIAGWLALDLAAQKPAATIAAPQPTQADRDSGYEVLAKGVVASRIFPIQFKSTPLRMEFRNLTMGKGISEAVTLPTQVLMEVRLGQVNTTVRNTKREYHQGDFWVAEKGDSVVLENTGEVAVIRAIYIYERAAGKE